MKAKKKLELIDKVLTRWDQGSCFYCGSTLNGDLMPEDIDDMNSDTFCQYCGKDIDPYDEWDQQAVVAIGKIVEDKDFKP